MNTSKFAILLMAFALPAVAFAWTLGDIDGSGKANAIDVQKVVSDILGFSKSTGGYDTDTNQDGVVNAKDVQLVITSFLDPTLESLDAFNYAPVLARFDLNLAAETTDDRFVTLDFACVGTPTEYMASEQADFLGAAWETYVDAANFLLSPGNGPKTVYLKLRNDEGESLVAQDSIELAEAVPQIVEIDSSQSDLSSHTVQLSIRTRGTALEYIVSESLDFSGAAWHAYESDFEGYESGHSVYLVNIPFALSAGSGDKTLYVKAKNETGESETVTTSMASDGRILDEMLLFSALINNGFSTTSSRKVTLNLVGTGVPLEYMASENADFHEAEWKTYTPDPSFLLSPISGLKTVYVRFRNNESISAVRQASITLAEPIPVITGTLVEPWPVTSLDINATIYCRYAPLEYILSESPDFTGATWKTCNYSSFVQDVPTDFNRYKFAVPFKLSPGTGSRQLYIRLRNLSGESEPSTISAFVQGLNLYSFSINGGAEVSPDCEVKLNIGFVGLLVEYMASENSDFQGAEWKPLLGTPSFTFTAGDGERTVHLKLRDASLEASASDTITLEGSLIPKIRKFNVNYNATEASHGAVQLISTCTMEPTEYIASESANFDNATWLPYTGVASFMLSGGDGSKTVYFKVRNSYAESVVVNDTILLQDQGAPYVFDRSWPEDIVTAKFRHRHVTDIEIDDGGYIYLVSESGFTNQKIRWSLNKYDAGGERIRVSPMPKGARSLTRTPTGELYVVPPQAQNYAPIYFLPSDLAQYGSRYIEGWERELRYIDSDSDGNLYGSFEKGRISKLAKDNSKELLAFNTGMDEAGELAVNKLGEIYIIYPTGNKVDRYSANGTLIQSWGTIGSAEGQFSEPKDIEFDAEGNVYIADYGNSRIQVFSPNGTFLRSWTVYKPLSLGLTPQGDVYVGTETFLYKFSANGKLLNGPSPTDFEGLSGIAVDASDNFYVADVGRRLIKKFSAAGAFVESWSPYYSEQESTWLRQVLAVSTLGKVYVADRDQKIREFTADGIFQKELEGNAYNLAVTPDNEVLAVRRDSSQLHINRYSTDGTLLETWYPEALGKTFLSDSIAVDPQGNVALLGSVITSAYNQEGRLARFNAQQQAQWMVPSSFPVESATCVATDSDGNIYAAANATIKKFDPNGTLLTSWGTSGRGPGYFGNISGIAVDSAGRVYVADSVNSCIQRFIPE